LADARKMIDLTGKDRSSRSRIIRWPTAPLAPTTATFFTLISGLENESPLKRTFNHFRADGRRGQEVI
jgi:hypothetical protein